MPKLLRHTLLLLIFICLTSCGFHLRGQANFAPPLHNLYLKTKDPYGDLAQYLRQYLKMSGIHLADSPEHASTVLEIISENTGQELLGVGSTQQTRQYNLTLTVKFQITTPGGGILVIAEKVKEERTLAINSNQILGSSNEATALYQQMRRAIIFDIINRLSSQEITTLLNKQPRTP